MSETTTLTRVRESNVDWWHHGELIVLGLGLFIRAMAASVVWAIVYNKSGATLSFRLFEDPIQADDWNWLDGLQTALLGVGILWFAGGMYPMRDAPLLVAHLAANAAVPVVDGLRVVGGELL